MERVVVFVFLVACLVVVFLLIEGLSMPGESLHLFLNTLIIRIISKIF